MPTHSDHRGGSSYDTIPCVPKVSPNAGKKSQRGEALLVTLPRSRPLYDDVCHLDHMSASAVARGNSQSAEGPAVHVPLSL